MSEFVMMLNKAVIQNDHEQEGEFGGVVNLSNHDLKTIGHLPKGISPYTLLLSNNAISKVENLQYFIHLQQLSLANNHIIDIRGVSAATHLRVLDLSNNRIVSIEGISSVRNLEWLNLSGNSIEKIENLDRNTKLYHLDLSDNSIAVISGLKSLKNLKTLLLHGNLISSLAIIKEEVSCTVCTLSLADNDISDLNEMLHLSCLTNLEQLSLLNNPCILTNGTWRLEVNYRPYLVYCCRNLRNLDGHLVHNDEKILARLLDQAFSHIGHPLQGDHVELVAILHHICSGSQEDPEVAGAHARKDTDSNTLLESESFFIPVPSSDEDQTESDDPIMTEEEAHRLFSLAATIIQAHVRGYLVRKKFDFCQYRRRKYAAACIQAAWKGYRVRTRDIKIVNIRNELRVRRLISHVNHLCSALDREHEEAVKSREQFKLAIKHLWNQILEQTKINEVQLRREQLKAAIRIQAWWRGCMARKLFPHKRMNWNQVTVLFAICRQLQTQLNVVTSRINDLTKGKIQDKESQHEAEQTDSEGQDQFYDTFGQLDATKDSVEANLAEDPESSPPIQHSHAALRPSPAQSLVEECDEKGELKSSDKSIPVLAELEAGDEFVSADTSLLLDPKLGSLAPFSGEMDHDASGIALMECDQKESGMNIDHSSNGFEEETRVSSALPGMEEKSSSLPETKHSENDTDEALRGPLDLETERGHDEVAHDMGDFLGERSSFSSLDQNEPHSEEVTSKPSVGTDQVRENTAPRVRHPLADSQEPDLTEKDINWDASEGKSLRASIPEIIVSSPVPTDDEGSDEGETSDAQREVKRKQKEKQGTAENHFYTDSALKFSSSFQVKNSDQKLSGCDTVSDEIKDNTFFKKERDLHEQFHENELESLNRVEGSLPLLASNRRNPGGEGEEVTLKSNSVFHGNVSNLGERATSLLSQLRSEIANMKTARLSSASPVITSGDDGTATDEGSTLHSNPDPENLGKSSEELTTQELDTTREIYDVSKPEHAPAVTYRLPLFEDVDSTCTSLSLDDFLSGPVFENTVKGPVSDTGCEPEGTDE